MYHEGGRFSRIVGAARLAVGLVVALAFPAGATSGWTGPRVSQTVLGNGLRVVVVENHRLPLVNVAVWYRFGSVDDRPGHYGIAHALEHMMFRGTRALSGTALDLVDARYGIEANAETDTEVTHYFQTAPVGALPVALHVEADRMRGLTLDPRDWTLERQAVLAELAGSESSAVGMLQEQIRATAFGRSPYAHDPIGNVGDLRATTTADLRRAYDRGYQPDNAVLVVAGDVQPAAVFAQVRSLFGSIRGHARTARPATEPVVRRGFVVRRHTAEASFVDVALEAQGVEDGGSAEEIAEELLRPTHAALRELLVDRGPCESYDVDDDAQLHGGLIHIVCRLDEDAKPARAVTAIEAALRRLAGHVPPHAIEYARRADIAATAFACDGLAAEGDLFGDTFALLGLDPRRFDRRSAALPDAAVAAVLRRWTHPVAVGIALGDQAFPVAHARKPREEHIASPTWSDAAREPAWARAPVAPFRAPAGDDVEAFALSNGLRVFVAPRRGNGTVYLRGGFARPTVFGDTSARDTALAERHAIAIDNGRVVDLHGFAPDFPLLLTILNDVWRPAGLSRNARQSRRAPRARNAWIAITGDVDPDTVRAAVTRTFAAWRDPETPSPTQPGASPSPSRSPRPLPTPGITAFGRARPSVAGFLMLPAPSRSDPDNGAMALLDAVLGRDGDFDTRLVHEVRVRRGLVYGIGTFYAPDRGQFFIYFDTASSQFAAARTAVLDVLSRARRGRITSDERMRAYDKLVAEALRDRSSPDGVLDTLSDAARQRATPDDVASLAARYRRVTVGDIERVAGTTLRSDRITEFDEGRAP